ncbi:MAG: hypothetical protein OXG64_06525 [Chloroflexi bacterium]|nr:hypothetical protein [Chloroflexota bacterium]
MPDEPKSEIDRELLQLRLDYAWRWFALHAKQRMTMFNYFLVASGILANAYGLLLREDFWEAAIVAASIGCLAGLVSWGLDVRNRQLVKLAEEVLANIEGDYVFPAESLASPADSPSSGILAREAKGREPSFLFKHRFLIVSLELVVTGGFLAAAVYACCMR